MWQFQPLSRPIFSEKTLDLSSFSLLKWTNLQAVKIIMQFSISLVKQG
jgi:hypothetical protein